ncbi:MAG TPA: 50S ribosomal protein L17 [Candidatus Sulfotelmatobacter sp.]|jgi:large subunit ribosomal protein L17|nr:50S ribosomal protein L17 [Candidatus Sulfotelmatobacter sp.]
MKKHVFGRHFKRDANERKALFKNLLSSLVMAERITTTEAKAKAIKAAADKLITKAKKGGPEAFRRLAPDVRYDAVAKLIHTIAPRFVDRQGGYTRIIKVGRRVADNAPQVVMEWVVQGEATVAKTEKTKKNEKKTEKKTAVKAPAAVVKLTKEAKNVKSAAPKKTVTRQKKG